MGMIFRDYVDYYVNTFDFMFKILNIVVNINVTVGTYL